jgi:hypothetical protein
MLFLMIGTILVLYDNFNPSMLALIFISTMLLIGVAEFDKGKRNALFNLVPLMVDHCKDII